MRKNLLPQVSRFGITGVAATVAHAMVLVTLVELVEWRATKSNMLAFLCAVTVSYLGNYYWTYESNREHRHSVWRFVLVALVAAVLNYAIFFLMVDRWGVHYLLALIAVVTTVPIISFIVQRTWVF